VSIKPVFDNLLFTMASAKSDDSDVPRYLCGFFDNNGDINVINDGNDIKVEAFQVSTDGKSPPSLKRFLCYYDGNVKREHEHGSKWIWSLTGQPVRRVLQDISDYGILKKPQADMLLRYLRVQNISHDTPTLKMGDKMIYDPIVKMLAKMKLTHAADKKRLYAAIANLYK